MDRAKQMEELGACAYLAFCEESRAFLPSYYPDWALLPDVVKNAWKAAAAAVLKAK